MRNSHHDEDENGSFFESNYSEKKKVPQTKTNKFVARKYRRRSVDVKIESESRIETSPDEVKIGPYEPESHSELSHR